MSFLDAYSSYNKIWMTESDIIHTSFNTKRGLFCYKVMLFGLKNAATTYRRLINKMFHKQLGKMVEAYIDNIVIKSRDAPNYVRDSE